MTTTRIKSGGGTSKTKKFWSVWIQTCAQSSNPPNLTIYPKCFCFHALDHFILFVDLSLLLLDLLSSCEVLSYWIICDELWAKTRCSSLSFPVVCLINYNSLQTYTAVFSLSKKPDKYYTVFFKNPFRAVLRNLCSLDTNKGWRAPRKL